jgi:predicted ATP-grasp superfamily ATP-dependent carboligase
MRVFVFEFITGGGLAREPLPPGLAEEGDRMLRALADDLLAAGAEVWASRDARLPALAAPLRTVVASGDPMRTFRDGVEAADAVWPIAPETGGALQRLTMAAVESGRLLLGSRPEAVAVASSKRRTAEALAAAGVAVAPAYGDAASIPPLPGPWVVKPDDGAGCVDTRLVADHRHAAALLAARPGSGLVAQPWIAGDALSLSLLCADGDASVLSCNRQRISVRDGRVALDGLTVAALPVDAEHRRLARGVARALPGLWGYAGVDFVAGAGGALAIEVNPRLTTSYCGLRDALGINVAARVLDLARRPGATPACAAPPAGRAVELELAACHGSS